jgi:hypothetical protein
MNVHADQKAEMFRGYLERQRSAAAGQPPDRDYPAPPAVHHVDDDSRAHRSPVGSP